MLFDLIKTITYDSAIPILSQDEVKRILLYQLDEKVHKNAIIMLADASYTTITEQKISEIYASCEIKNYKYREEAFDCDDFSVVFKSAIAKSAGSDWRVKYPYAAGIVFGYIPTPHAINWFITPDKKVMFMEPQTGSIFNPKGDRIFFIFS